jgi:hypothetical protein
MLLSEGVSVSDKPGLLFPKASPKTLINCCYTDHVYYGMAAKNGVFPDCAVFDTNNANLGWDGTVNGTNAPMGAYVYTIETVSAKGERVIQKGSVALIR